jgi:uncharacterized Zn-finger protein
MIVFLYTYTNAPHVYLFRSPSETSNAVSLNYVDPPVTYTPPVWMSSSPPSSGSCSSFETSPPASDWSRDRHSTGYGIGTCGYHDDSLPQPTNAAPVTTVDPVLSFLGDDVSSHSASSSTSCDDLLVDITAMSPGPIPQLLSPYFPEDDLDRLLNSPKVAPVSRRKGKAHTCGLCLLTFSSRIEYSKHVKSLHKQLTHACDICQKEFKQLSTMRTHRRKHTGERPFTCPWCSRTFSDHSSFIKHKRIHSNDRPYTCLYCPKTFIQSGNCNRHMRCVHGHK